MSMPEICCSRSNRSASDDTRRPSESSAAAPGPFSLDVRVSHGVGCDEPDPIEVGQPRPVNRSR